MLTIALSYNTMSLKIILLCEKKVRPDSPGFFAIKPAPRSAVAWGEAVGAPGASEGDGGARRLDCSDGERSAHTCPSLPHRAL